MLVVDAQRTSSTRGLSFRKGINGPEQDLLDWFLHQKVISVPRGHNVTVFREPRLPSGFPDLVFVVWRESVARHWTDERARLTARDLRIMHFLGNEGPTSTEDLRLLFSDDVENRLALLAEAQMVRAVGKAWKARSLDSTFAASHIIAVEAKINEWKGALDQAHLNTWFASESCILVPRVPRNSELLHAATERGVRVLAKEDASSIKIDRPVRCGPKSYVSWLFSEWAWRASIAIGES